MLTDQIERQRKQIETLRNSNYELRDGIKKYLNKVKQQSGNVMSTIYDTEIIKVTLNLELNGGTTNYTKTYTGIPSSYIYWPTPVKEGWRFISWFNKDETIDLVDGDKIVFPNEDFTVYAKWEKN